MTDRVTNTTDRAGRKTDFTYAPMKKLTSVTRYLNEGGSNTPVRIAYDFDKMFNGLNITEPRGRYVESYQLDLQDRVIAVTNIEGQAMSIDYYVGDKVSKITRFDGSTISNAYDSAARLSSATYRTAGGPPATVAYDYYPDGEIKTISDGFSSVSNAYDRLNRITGITNQVAGISSAATHQYDGVNLTNTTISVNSVALCENSYLYDDAERLIEIISHEGTEAQSFVYAYNSENGRVASVSNTVSGLTCSYEYDVMDRATNIAYTTSDGSLIRSLEYEYNATSMIAKKTIYRGTNCTSTAYTYDSLDRLVAEKRTAGILPAQSQSYSYDLAGNRTAKTSKDWKITYTLGTGNRLASSSSASNSTFFVSGSSSEPIGSDNRWGTLSVSNLTTGASVVPGVNGASFYAEVPILGNATNTLVAAIRDQAGNMGYATNDVFVPLSGGSGSTPTAYGYDSAGCLTNINGASLEWDERYRLTRYVVPPLGGSLEYAYDVLGRRVSRTEIPPEGGTINMIHFIYNGNQVVADLDGSGNLLRTYVWGTGIDNLLSFTDHVSTNTYYAIKDHQNTVIALVDETGSVVESYEYSAYGEVLDVKDGAGNSIVNQQSAIGNRYTFQGREIDWATGLYYFRARWYDPAAGRWLSKDPIGISGGFNLYVFCGNNPVNYVDPFGERWFGGGDDPEGWTVGRDKPGSLVKPGPGEVGGWLEQYVPAMETMSEYHDALVGFLTNKGAPDWLVNIPTMKTCYDLAVLKETLDSLKDLFDKDKDSNCK